MQDKLNPTADFSASSQAAIYVHVPFCGRPCAYCRFYKTRPARADLEAYLDALETEASAFFESNPALSPRSIFFGGGTPTTLSAGQLERLCGVFSCFGGVEEWSVEASPASLSADKLRAMKNCGVNRISLGVQSFDENILKSLGRSHSQKNSREAIALALEYFENVNIDMIFGAQPQSLDMWLEDLRIAASFPVKHISAYCLEFESGTSCCAGLEKPMHDQEREVDFLNATISALADAGFAQYEISNYAKPGWECVQNINTWRMGEWVGFGPSAASQFKGLRYRNADNLETWLNGVQKGAPQREDIIELDDDEMFSSAIIFGLRMTGGIDFEYMKKRFPKADFERHHDAISRLAAERLLEMRGNVLKLTCMGIPLADAVGAEFV